MKYYEITQGSIEPIKQTDKAICVIIGTNGHISHKTLKYHYEFIAKSIIKVIDEKIFVPAWIAKNINVCINWDSFIEVKEESKPKKRRTKKEIEEDNYNLLLKSHFNGEIPNEYIEYWFENALSVGDTRFTTIDRLENRINKEEIVKINIVRGNNKITIK